MIIIDKLISTEIYSQKSLHVPVNTLKSKRFAPSSIQSNDICLRYRGSPELIRAFLLQRVQLTGCNIYARLFFSSFFFLQKGSQFFTIKIIVRDNCENRSRTKSNIIYRLVRRYLEWKICLSRYTSEEKLLKSDPLSRRAFLAFSQRETQRT